VDDEAALREIAKETLESFGYSVLTAADGAEAVAVFAARSGEVGAVVTDMTMPIMDGPSTIRALRRIDPRVRIIATSGREIQVSNGSVVPDVDILPKPFTAAELLGMLARVLASEPKPPAS
jgi:CheY-like chemotaxis protein